MTFQKLIGALTEADLQTLVKESVSESDTLDYKAEMYAENDKSKKEMLRDVSSMANARGGYLFIGIREKDDVAAELIGIADGDSAAQRLLSSCLSGIHERINGLDARPIPLGNGKAVLAVFIPPSLRTPHMVTFQGEDRCWIRHGRQKMRMNVEEIREACSRVETIFEDLEAFLRRQKDRAGARARRNVGVPILRVSITPLPVREERVDIARADIRKLMNEPSGMRSGGFVIEWPVGVFVVEPTLNGLQISASDLHALEVFRNGNVEFRVGFNRAPLVRESEIEGGRTLKVLAPIALVEYTVSLVRFSQELAKLTPLTGPLVLSWEVRNAGDIGITRHPSHTSLPRPEGGYYGPRPFTEGMNLVIPEIQVPDVTDPDRLAKRVMDRVWQAFGYEAAPYFDADGQFAPPR